MVAEQTLGLVENMEGSDTMKNKARNNIEIFKIFLLRMTTFDIIEEDDWSVFWTKEIWMIFRRN